MSRVPRIRRAPSEPGPPPTEFDSAMRYFLSEENLEVRVMPAEAADYLQISLWTRLRAIYGDDGRIVDWDDDWRTGKSEPAKLVSVWASTFDEGVSRAVDDYLDKYPEAR